METDPDIRSAPAEAAARVSRVQKELALRWLRKRLHKTTVEDAEKHQL